MKEAAPAHSLNLCKSIGHLRAACLSRHIRFTRSRAEQNSGGQRTYTGLVPEDAHAWALLGAAHLHRLSAVLWPTAARNEPALPKPPAAAAPADDGQWTMPAKNYASTRFSDIAEINTDNVKNLQVAFT